MDWTEILKRQPYPAHLNESYDNILYWGRIFDELGWLGPHDAWYYFGNPHKWQPEYDVMLDVMQYIEENLQEEVGDYDDPLAISSYLYDEGVAFGGADDWQKWLNERKEDES